MPDKENNGQNAVENARRLLDFLAKRRDSLSPLLIMTHNYPDPDALASAFALSYLSQQYFGITSKIAYAGVIGRSENKAMVRYLKIPLRKFRPDHLKKFRNIALVDTQPKFQNNAFPEDRRATIIIDQHASAEKPAADLSVIDTNCGATCVIVANALLLQGEPIPAKIATALVYGILTDTLGLYRARRPDVIQTYLSIIPFCDLRLLAQIQYPSRSKSFFVTLHRALNKAILHRHLLVSHLGFVENPDLVSQMADFLLTYEGTRWAFCTGRFKGSIYVSLRSSRSGVQAGEILRSMFENHRDAGGHGNIAGGSYKIAKNPTEEQWREAESSLQAKLFRKLRRSSKAEYQRPFQWDIPPSGQ